MVSSVKRAFIGTRGVRSGWRVLLFGSLLVGVIGALIIGVRAVRARLAFPPSVGHVLTPGRALLNEACFMLAVILTTAVFARFERRDFADYGLPLDSTVGRRFLEGLLWGVAMMSFVLLVLGLTGNFHFGAVVLTPGRIATYAVAWAIFFVMVGVAETFAFSGYPLFALSRSLGFWPAAASLALVFGAIHFVANSGENWLGSVSLAVVGLLVAFTLQQTGNLWFAIGMHAAWDWAQSFLYGVADSGVAFAGHLLDPTWRGSTWMTGGTAGPEASVVTVLGYVIAFALIKVRFPEKLYRTLLT